MQKAKYKTKRKQLKAKQEARIKILTPLLVSVPQLESKSQFETRKQSKARKMILQNIHTWSSSTFHVVHIITKGQILPKPNDAANFMRLMYVLFIRGQVLYFF